MKHLSTLLFSLLLANVLSAQCGFSVNTTVTGVPCHGSDLTVNISGGAGPYAVSGLPTWPQIPPQVVIDSFTFHNLYPEVFDLTITDQNNCDSIFSITTVGLWPLYINIVDTFCYYIGFADAGAIGGTEPFTYLWSTGETHGGGIIPPSPGMYYVTVTDAIGCTATDSVYYYEPFGAIVNATDETCLGNDGTATVSGATWHNWSNGETTASITGLVSGMYTVDLNYHGCMYDDTVYVNNPNLNMTVSSTPAACLLHNGTATVTLLGNPLTPTFLWSNGQTGSTATSLAPGGHSVTVTDGAGCMSHRNVIVPDLNGCYSLIEGHVFDDHVVPDCVVDQATSNISGVMVRANTGNTNRYDYIQSNDPYSIEIQQLGYWSVEPIGYNMAAYSNICGPLTVPVTSMGQVLTGNDFYMDLDTTYVDMAILMATQTVSRPGSLVEYYIEVYNNGGNAQSGTISVDFEDFLTNFDPSQIPLSFDPVINKAFWSFNNLPHHQSMGLEVNFLVPVGTLIGTPVVIAADLSNIPNDAYPYNNTASDYHLVIGAFDPNSKSISPIGDGPTHDVGHDIHDLTYTINFQNTGNDTAFVVVLRDTIDTQRLDIESIHPFASSHPYQLSIDSNNVLVFTFENINLLDSNHNEPASHGYVAYNIQVKPGLPFGDRIDNRAAIYFDYNAPVITNTAFVTLQSPVGVNQPYSLAQFNVSPNPATEMAQLSYTLQATDRVECWLSDAMGRRVMSVVPSQLLIPDEYSVDIPLQGLESGVYFVTMQTGTGRVTRKLVVF